MRFHVGSDEAKFFRRQGFVEFEGVFTPEQLAEIRANLDVVLKARMKKSLSGVSPDELYRHGHNLFRDNQAIKRVVLDERLAEIASQLCGLRSLRLAFDQAIATKDLLLPTSFSQPLTLSQMSSIFPTVMGALIALSPRDSAKSSEAAPSEKLTVLKPLPHHQGNVIFFSPDLGLSLSDLIIPHAEFLLLAYAPEVAVYQLNPQDLHTHVLKREGMVFGDRITNTTHPRLLS